MNCVHFRSEKIRGGNKQKKPTTIIWTLQNAFATAELFRLLIKHFEIYYFDTIFESQPNISCFHFRFYSAKGSSVGGHALNHRTRKQNEKLIPE